MVDGVPSNLFPLVAITNAKTLADREYAQTAHFIDGGIEIEGNSPSLKVMVGIGLLGDF